MRVSTVSFEHLEQLSVALDFRDLVMFLLVKFFLGHSVQFCFY